MIKWCEKEFFLTRLPVYFSVTYLSEGQFPYMCLERTAKDRVETSFNLQTTILWAQVRTMLDGMLNQKPN